METSRLIPADPWQGFFLLCATSACRRFRVQEMNQPAVRWPPSRANGPLPFCQFAYSILSTHNLYPQLLLAFPRRNLI